MFTESFSVILLAKCMLLCPEDNLLNKGWLFPLHAASEIITIK